MPKPPTVELHAAFVFACEDCGRDTFVRAISYEGLPPGLDPADLPDDVDLGDLEGGWFSAPVDVKCGHCGPEFEAEAH